MIRDHFHAIDIDPGFRIGEEGELKLLRHDVLEEMLEEKYQEGSKPFLAFTAAYSTGRNDKKIEEMFVNIKNIVYNKPSNKNWRDLDLFIKNAFAEAVIDDFKSKFLKHIRKKLIQK